MQVRVQGVRGGCEVGGDAEEEDEDGGGQSGSSQDGRNEIRYSCRCQCPRPRPRPPRFRRLTSTSAGDVPRTSDLTPEDVLSLVTLPHQCRVTPSTPTPIILVLVLVLVTITARPLARRRPSIHVSFFAATLWKCDSTFSLPSRLGPVARVNQTQ